MTMMIRPMTVMKFSKYNQPPLLLSCKQLSVRAIEGRRIAKVHSSPGSTRFPSRLPAKPHYRRASH